uniref:Reverse transcriptase n=1 Tax=Tanacetum cinerariifolium TaxID=118510 RepID=A0A6L2LI68_TANCI|nr:reverse transcriptase [Tanacetum cinerariifolium]
MGTVAEYQNEFEMLMNRVTGISESLLTSFYIFGFKLTIQIELLRARPTTLGEAFSLAGSLDADEDIRVDEVSSAIDCVIHIGESNEVRSKFGEFSDNKQCVVEVVVGGGETLVVYREQSRGAQKKGAVLCPIQRKAEEEKDGGCNSKKIMGSRNQDFLDNTLRTRTTTLGEAFSLAGIIEARFEAIAEKEKEHINKKKVDTILSLQHKLASPEIKGSLDADEDIRVDEVSSAIDCVIHIGESNEVRSKFGEFSDNKQCVVEVVVGGGETLVVYREQSRGAQKKGAVLCPIQRKAEEEKDGGCNSKKIMGSRNQDFLDNTLRTR